MTPIDKEPKPGRETFGTKRLPHVLFINTQPRQRITNMGLPPYESWIARGTSLPSSNIRTINVAEGEPLPSTFDNIDAIIGGGSEHTVTKNQPWMRDTADFFKKAHMEGIPQLLICFSHQLYALNNGAILETLPVKRLGLKLVELTPEGRDDPLLEGFPDVFPVFTSNRLVVKTKPQENGLVVAELGVSQDKNEILVYQRPDTQKTRVASTQFHPELDAEIIAALYKEQDAFSSGEIPEDFDLGKIYEYDNDVQEHGRRFFGNWLAHEVFPLIQV